jgi:hypothetical protein
VELDCQGIGIEGATYGGPVKEEYMQLDHRGKVKKEEAKLEHAKNDYAKLSSKETSIKEEEKNIDLILKIEDQILNANLKELKVAELKSYLRVNGLDDKGKKEQLIDRILVFM